MSADKGILPVELVSELEPDPVFLAWVVRSATRIVPVIAKTRTDWLPILTQTDQDMFDQAIESLERKRIEKLLSHLRGADPNASKKLKRKTFGAALGVVLQVIPIAATSDLNRSKQLNYLRGEALGYGAFIFEISQTMEAIEALQPYYPATTESSKGANHERIREAAKIIRDELRAAVPSDVTKRRTTRGTNSNSTHEIRMACRECNSMLRDCSVEIIRAKWPHSFQLLRVIPFCRKMSGNGSRN